MPQPSRSVRWLIAAGIVPVVVLPLVGVATTNAGASPSSARVTLPGSAPRWVAGLEAPSATTGGSPVDVRIFLAPRGGQAALDAAVASVSTPGSPQYRHFVTPEQYRQRFEPTDDALSHVRSWLSTNGFQVTGVEGARRYVTAHGNAAAAKQAFGVSLRNYSHRGRTVQAPTADASVPSDVAGLVTGVTGLDNEPHLVTPGVNPAAPPPTSFTDAKPCSQYYGQLPAHFEADHKTPLPAFRGTTRPYAVCGYTPNQLRSAYGIPSTKRTGKGVTIGIVDAYAASTILSDANAYSRRHGEPPFAAGQFSQSNASRYRYQGQCAASGWGGEETLDIEAAHGIAPASGVRYYGAASCSDSDLLDALKRTVDENKVDIVSNSYGSPESDESAGDLVIGSQLYQQAAMQGISVLFSSGDEGDERANSDSRQPDSPASNPDVTAVGGTSTAIGRTGALLWQTGWGTRSWALSKNGASWSSPTYLYGSGGGDSTLFRKPSYQNGVVPAGEGGGRAVPDVALDADPNTGMVIGETQVFGSSVRYGEFRLGGTSLSSPLMAGMTALAGQQAQRLGLLNPGIYAAVRSGKGQFTDVKAVHVGDAQVRPDYADPAKGSGPVIYTVRTFGQDSSLTLRNGWDETTGVGAPNARFVTGFGG